MTTTMTTHEVIMHGTRQDKIEWLQNNDPNGCYSDEDSDNEGLPRLTNLQLVELIIRQLAQD